MDQFLHDFLGDTSGLAAYLSVFGVLMACGLGIPLPEDVSLLLGGYLAHRGAARLPIMMAVGFIGILTGDSLIYLAGRRMGARVVERGFLARVVTPKKREKVERLFATHGQKIVMLARFLPGVRAVTYFTAGSARMSYVRFILWDALAALGSAPLFVYLGYKFGHEFEVLTDMLQDGQVALALTIVAAVIGYVIYKRRRAAVIRAFWARRRSELSAASAQAAKAAAVEKPGDPASPREVQRLAAGDRL